MLKVWMVAVWVIAAQPLDVVILEVDGLTRNANELTERGYSTVGLDGVSALPAETLLLLPQPRVFPAAGISEIEAFLTRGGHLVAAGGPPFESLVYLASDGAWVALDGLLAEVAPEHPLVDWDAVNAAPPRGGSSHPSGAAYTPLPDGYEAALAIPGAASWDVREIPVATPAPPGDDVLRFRVSGHAPPGSLLVEVREQDGSRWMAKAPLTAEPREVGLHRNAFDFWPDGSPPSRGFKGDAPDFSKLAAMQFGFAASHQELDAGRYTYRIEGLATGRCESEVTVASLPRLEAFSPPYKLFATTVARAQILDGFPAAHVTVPADVFSPIARPMHEGSGRDYLWQPHVKAFDAEDRWIATPLSTTWHNSGATWSFVGWEPNAEDLDAILQALATVLANGKPAVPPPALLNDDSPSGATVTVSGGRFMLDGAPWFANGINFWPRYVAGMEPPEYYSHWLNPSDYIPELVDQDLAILQTLGVNVVSIQFEREDEVPQLRDFLTRCGRYGIKANIFLRGAHPLQPSATGDLSRRPFLDLMRAANLRGNPHVFAYDLAWEPRMGVYNERKRYDGLFKVWIEEQYGSVARAETVWGAPVNRDDNGLTCPTDEQLREDGPHRIMVAAYRRFADDLISRRYGEIVRLARAIDDTHLFGVRTGYGGTGTKGVVRVMPFQLTSGAAHLDFLSPEGYGYGPKNISDAAFVTAYARWAGNGKPVFWAEFGYTVLNGGAEALGTQADLYGAFAEMVVCSDADGWAGWWYPGGLRVDERSDYGIVAPDGVPRPATVHLQDLANRGGELRAYTPPIDTLGVQRDQFPDGLSGVIEKNAKDLAESYRQGAIPRVITEGTGTTSITCPYTGVGGVPYSAPGPPQYVNAEISAEALPGGGTRISVLNTGEAAWTPEDCVLVLESGSEDRVERLPGTVSRFEGFGFEITGAVSGRAFMRSGRFGPFGQRRVLE